MAHQPTFEAAGLAEVSNTVEDVQAKLT